MTAVHGHARKYVNIAGEYEAIRGYEIEDQFRTILKILEEQ
jgi:hypothetical protein